jgi:hypothetical protein
MDFLPVLDALQLAIPITSKAIVYAISVSTWDNANQTQAADCIFARLVRFADILSRLLVSLHVRRVSAAP